MKELLGFIENMNFLKSVGVCTKNTWGSGIRKRAEASFGQCYADITEDKSWFKKHSYNLIWNVKWNKRIICLLLKLRQNHKSKVSSNSGSLKKKGKKICLSYSALTITHSRSTEQPLVVVVFLMYKLHTQSTCILKTLFLTLLYVDNFKIYISTLVGNYNG